MNFTDEVKFGTRKYSCRGISSLAKFTSANGNVYGTLALDTRRATDDDTQELPVAVRVAYDGKTVYLRIGKKYTMGEWLELCECEKQGRNKKAAERKDLKNLMQKVENQVNQLIAEDSFSLRRIQELHQGKADNDCTIYSVWDSIIDNKREKKVQEQPDVIKMCADVLKDTWVLMYNLLTSTNRLLTNGLRL